MHRYDDRTDRIADAVFAYMRDRLALDPVPLDRSVDPAELEARAPNLIGAAGNDPARVLELYSEILAPAVISCDSPRFLAFIPAAPTKASLLFDMIVSCASLSGVSWVEAAGAVHAENQALRFLSELAGLPAEAGGVFVSGGSAANAAPVRWSSSAGTINGSTSMIRIVFATDECVWSLTAMRHRRGGSPARVVRACSRATTSAERFAAEPPDTNTPPASAGKPANSLRNRRA